MTEPTRLCDHGKQPGCLDCLREYAARLPQVPPIPVAADLDLRNRLVAVLRENAKLRTIPSLGPGAAAIGLTEYDIVDLILSELPPQTDQAPGSGREIGELFPARLGVYCDGCGTTVQHDYVIDSLMPKPERLEVARTHLRRHEGWTCDAEGDYCPKCLTPATRRVQHLEQLLALVQEFYVRVPIGPLSHVVVRREKAGVDLWAVTDGSITGLQAWVDDRWQRVTDTGRAPAFRWPLDQVMEVAEQAAEAEARSWAAQMREFHEQAARTAMLNAGSAGMPALPPGEGVASGEVD